MNNFTFREELRVKIALIYNRESQNVINLFGLPNREKIGKKTIKRITDALKKGGHQVIALEGDKDLVDRLEEFMPRVLKGERPGMAFNVSYGIQGQARYTHVPSILEMIGIPYVASGPLAHSLALDKVVTKMILRQHNIPTPDFAVLNGPNDIAPPDLSYPLIVKPKNEAVSFGLKIVNNDEELKEAAAVIYNEFQQPVLAEQYIEGREINVGLLGNSPPEVLPPVELAFGEEGPAVYSYEDKTGASGRTIGHICPAPIGEELTLRAEDLARRAFSALGCYDCARVDMRLDKENRLYVLELNSLPSLGEHGSYLIGAEYAGLDFAAVINRLVEVASARYFGTPTPPQFDTDPQSAKSSAFSFITQRRDELEKRLEYWTNLSSRTTDSIGLRQAVQRAGRTFREVGLGTVPDFTDDHVVWTWETRRGFQEGTLLIAHLDSPTPADVPRQRFHRDAEWLYGEGIGSSRASLVMVEFALRALRSTKQLRHLPLGLLLYADEGRDARYSASKIEAAAAKAGTVLVLRPGNIADYVINSRRGQRKYGFRVEGPSIKPGGASRRPEIVRWAWGKLDKISQLTSRKKRMSVSVLDLHTEGLPGWLPHSLSATILVTYPRNSVADEIDHDMRTILGRGSYDWELEPVSDRPPMPQRRKNTALAQELAGTGEEWQIPVQRQSSVWPSVAGLVPAGTSCLCGVGPCAHNLGTPQEAVQRISLVQRTLLLAQFLTDQQAE